MVQLTGTYYNGQVHLEKSIQTKKPLRIIITFQEEIEADNEGLQLSDFSFLKSQKLLHDYKGSFSDEVITERRNAV